MKLNSYNNPNKKYLSYRLSNIFPVPTRQYVADEIYISVNTYNEAGFDCLFSLAFEKARARNNLTIISSPSKLNFYFLLLPLTFEFLIIFKNYVYFEARFTYY